MFPVYVGTWTNAAWYIANTIQILVSSQTPKTNHRSHNALDCYQASEVSVLVSCIVGMGVVETKHRAVYGTQQ